MEKVSVTFGEATQETFQKDALKVKKDVVKTTDTLLWMQGYIRTNIANDVTIKELRLMGDEVKKLEKRAGELIKEIDTLK